MNRQTGRRHARWPYEAFPQGGSNTESVQPDETQFDYLRSQMVNGMLPYECVIKLMQAKNSPPQVRQSSYTCILTAANTPVLLIPTNNKRLGFVIANVAEKSIAFSYDAPKTVTIGAGNISAGIPIPTLGFFIESNGLASVNDIYVFSNDATMTYPTTVLGFEAVVTITPDNVV